MIRIVTATSTPKPCIYVASDTNVLAALDPASGSVLWRKLLDEDDDINRLQASGDVVVALSSNSQVRAFGAKGQMLWEAWLPEDGGAGGADLALAAGTKVIAARGGSVVAFSLKTGVQEWTASVASSPQGTAALFAGLKEQNVLVAMADAGGKTVTTATLQAADGAIIEQGSGASSRSIDLASLAVMPAGVVAACADGSCMCSGSISGGGLSCQRAAGGSAAITRGTCTAAVTGHTAEGVSLFGLDGEIMQAVATKPGAVASGCFPGQGKSAAAAVATVSSVGLELSIVSAVTGDVLSQEVEPALVKITPSGNQLGLAKVFGFILQGTPRALVQLQEGSLALMGGGSTAWIRHEALASISDLLFADLAAPTPENEAEWEASQPTWSESFSMQLLALRAQAGLRLEPQERAALARHQALTSDRLRPTRDADGFRRQLIVATKAGKVAALHTGDGGLLWEVDFGAEAAPQRLAAWLKPHDMRRDEEVVAFRADDAGVVATVINIHTGLVVSSDVVAASAGAEVLPMPHPVRRDSADQHVYLVVPAQGPATVLPRIAEAQAAFAAGAHALVQWGVDQAAGTVHGFGFGADGSRTVRWSMVAAPAGSGLSVLAVAARDAAEAVYGAARPIAGGAILLKYLSPNTLLVLAGPPLGLDHAKASRLVATLLDAASGRVLFTQTHQGAGGPVHAVITEHSAIYHYWSAKRSRWQLTSIDAYTDPPPGLTVTDIALGRHRAAANASDSAWDVPPLRFDTQTFLSKLSAATLAVTTTAHGTTAKMLLLGTPSGQVYMLDRRLVDARRPVIGPGAKPTPEQMAEMLPPYQPELPLAGTSFATLDKRVGRLQSVVTAPAVLESASLMAAAGLDLFYSRLQPSKGFDMVPDDFPHALLVAVVVGMAGAAVVLRVMLQRRALKLKWQ